MLIVLNDDVVLVMLVCVVLCIRLVGLVIIVVRLELIE